MQLPETEAKKNRKETLKRVKKHYAEKKKKHLEQTATTEDKPVTRQNPLRAKLTVAMKFKKSKAFSKNQTVKSMVFTTR